MMTSGDVANHYGVDEGPGVSGQSLRYRLLCGQQTGQWAAEPTPALIVGSL